MKSYQYALIVFAMALASQAIAASSIESVHETLSEDGLSRHFWAEPSDQVPGQQPVIYMSTDRGETWDATTPVPVNEIMPSSITGMMHGWDHVYVGTDGEGVFRTTDGRSWEKWNEADVGIRYMTQAAVGKLAVITEDGALFMALEQQFSTTFGQAYDYPLTATSVSISDGTVVGTANGEVFARGFDGVVNMNDGLDGRPGPMPGAVRDIVHENGRGYYVVELADGSQALYTADVSPNFPDRPVRMSLDGAALRVETIASAGPGIGAITSTDPQRMIYSCDLGATWLEVPLPVTTGVNSFKSGGCGDPGEAFRVVIATDEGGFQSYDSGMTWTAYGDTGSGGSLVTANTDVGISMRSPTPVQGAISPSTSQFVIEITNHGPEPVEKVGVYLDVTAWYPSGVSHAEGTKTIDGIACEPRDDLFQPRTRDCLIERLEPGQTVDLVMTRSLGADAYGFRIEGLVESDRLNDTNINNDRLFFDVTVRDGGGAGDESGGGGGTGFWLLAALLIAARRK